MMDAYKTVLVSLLNTLQNRHKQTDRQTQWFFCLSRRYGGTATAAGTDPTSSSLLFCKMNDDDQRSSVLFFLLLLLLFTFAKFICLCFSIERTLSSPQRDHSSSWLTIALIEIKKILSLRQVPPPPFFP